LAVVYYLASDYTVYSCSSPPPPTPGQLLGGFQVFAVVGSAAEDIYLLVSVCLFARVSLEGRKIFGEEFLVHEANNKERKPKFSRVVASIYTLLTKHKILWVHSV